MKKSLLDKEWISYGELDNSKSLYENIIKIKGKELNDFAFPKFSDFISPFEFRDMEKSVNIILETIKEGKRIMIFGDYDLDGMSGAALLFLTLKTLNGNFSYRLPSRSDGYGLSEKFIYELKEKNISLFITTDCGISNYNEISKANSYDVKTIITDHHSVPSILPPAYSILHPLLKTEPFPDKNLTGAGVTWQLCRALLQKVYGKDKSRSMEESLLEIAMLGTIADCGKLEGENRKIVLLGLQKIKSTKNNALRKLIEISKSDINNLTAEVIAFFIAPRLNASGRLAHPKISLELLIGNENRVLELDNLNRQRQGLLDELLKDAFNQAKKQKNNPTILVHSTCWPGGMIGLISGRLAEIYGKPTIAFEVKNDKWTGSCRGPLDFDIANSLKFIQKNHPEYFLGCGGHAQAAGLSIYPKYFNAFCDEYSKLVIDKRGVIPPVVELFYFGEIKQNLNFKNIEDLDLLEPFGVGNEHPAFLFKSLIIKTVRAVGNDKQHLSLILDSAVQKELIFNAIWFREGNKLSLLKEGMYIDIVGVISVQTWKNTKRLSLRVLDVKLL
jgi:single-stranded-DNA-specific exonuclease